MKYTDNIYQLETTFSKLEMDLLETPELKRLSKIHHAGLSIYDFNLPHSRLEHTLGVLVLTSYLTNDNPTLRIVALLHDIGHLPFSHSMELALMDKTNHHTLTRYIIMGTRIQNILKSYNIDCELICNLVTKQKENPITNSSEYLSVDNLDGFLRDYYYLVGQTTDYSELIRNVQLIDGKISITKSYSETLQDSIYEDNCRFVNKDTIIRSVLFKKSVQALFAKGDLTLNHLQSIGDKEFVEYLSDLIGKHKQYILPFWSDISGYEIEKAISCKCTTGWHLEFTKFYNKNFLVEGIPATRALSKYELITKRIEELRGSFCVSKKQLY